MKRFVFIAALCIPVAGLATTFDSSAALAPNIIEIRVSADELADCEETLRQLRARPAVTDAGTWIPAFLRNDDLPRTVCVLRA